MLLADSIACDTCPPPRNLDGMTQDDAANLWWQVPLLIDTIISNDTNYLVPTNLLGYNLYRNNLLLEYLEYIGEDTGQNPAPEEPGLLDSIFNVFGGEE